MSRSKFYKNLTIFQISVGFLLFTVLLSLLYHLATINSLLYNHLTELFAIIFLFSPFLFFKAVKEHDFTDFGFSFSAILKGLLISVIILGGYIIAHYFWFKTACTAGSLPTLGRSCSHYKGSFLWPLGVSSTLNLLAVHLIAVAMPEEFFYRGFLMPLILKSKSLKKYSLLKRYTYAIILQALFFGLGHFLVDGNPMRLAVIFPALLFGTVAIWSRSITSTIIIHGLANFISEILEKGWFTGV